MRTVLVQLDTDPGKHGEYDDEYDPDTGQDYDQGQVSVVAGIGDCIKTVRMFFVGTGGGFVATFRAALSLDEYRVRAGYGLTHGGCAEDVAVHAGTGHTVVDHPTFTVVVVQTVVSAEVDCLFQASWAAVALFEYRAVAPKYGAGLREAVDLSISADATLAGA